MESDVLLKSTLTEEETVAITTVRSVQVLSNRQHGQLDSGSFDQQVGIGKCDDQRDARRWK